MFIERGVQLLTSGGRLGLIVQDAFTLNENSHGVRALACQACRVDCVLEFPVRNSMFADVHKGSLVLVLSKRPQQECTCTYPAAHMCSRAVDGGSWCRLFLLLLLSVVGPVVVAVVVAVLAVVCDCC